MNKYEEKYLKLIQGENVNVSESNLAKDFFKPVAKVICAIFILFIFCELSSNIFISFMPNKTQRFFESSISAFVRKENINSAYQKEIEQLEKIKEEMLNKEPKLKITYASFPINIVDYPKINAFITSDGSIYFTNKLIKENLSEEELAFIMAHEFGHYYNRHHLKTISRQVMFSLIVACLLKDSSNQFSASMENISNLGNLKYSRTQEKEADLFANKMVKEIYGTNNGAIAFFNKLKKWEETPEYLEWFSTHPPASKRLHIVKNAK